MKEIIITKRYGLNKGQQTQVMVDDDDYDFLSQYTWSQTKLGYVCLSCNQLGLKKGTYMHRMILNAGSNEVIDHANRNVIDNRKSNIRVCSRRLNNANKQRTGRNGIITSKYKGVCRASKIKYYKKKTKQTVIVDRRKPWAVVISNNNKNNYIGYFKTEEEAAMAYNEAALRIYGEFAFVNVIE